MGSTQNELLSCLTDQALSFIHQLLAKKTPNDQLHAYVMSIIKHLSDPHPSASSGVCVVLNSTLKMRGSELALHVSDLHFLNEQSSQSGCGLNYENIMLSL